MRDNFSYKTKRKNKEAGFTLIASLFLLSILMLLGVAMAMLTVIEARQAMNKKNLANARSNARFAVQMALHQLQETSGPDQRISAPSSIWKDEQGKPNVMGEQHWTGVWHSNLRTWDPLARQWHNEGRERDPYNGEWKQDPKPPDELQKQAWLVSGADRKINDQWLSPENVSLHPEAITIFEAPNPSQPDPDQPDASTVAVDDVHVPAVHIPARNSSPSAPPIVENRYAYWVADEGTKLKVNFHEDPVQQYRGMAPKNLLDLQNLLSPRGNHLIDDESANRILTPNTLLATDADIDEDLPVKHHYTTYSRGVLANVARGGLKKDLSRGLGDQFPDKLAGKVMWQEALPQRGPDGKILDLDKFRMREDLAIDEDTPEQHRQFLRGPIWDVAHSWYSLYLPRPPFMPGFDGGIRNRLDPKYKDEPWLPKPNDPVGNGRDPALYRYSPNTMNHGPLSQLQSSAQESPWLESRSTAGSSHNNWLFMTDHRTRFTFTNIPRWIHKKRIDVNIAMFPNGPFYRRERTRHSIAPVFLESTVKIGFFAVDGTYLWDLQVRGRRGNYWRYRCDRDNYPLDITPKDWKKVNPIDPMPVCPSCGINDQMRFLNGFVAGSFGKFNDWGKPKDKHYPTYHLDKTKARRQILEFLVSDPAFKAVLSQEGHGGIANAWKLMKHNGGPLDAEKHSMGLRNGTAIEQAAYAAMRDIFKLQMIIRPYVVFWNPYNVTIKNAMPGLGFHMGNSRGRFDSQNSLHLPDAQIETSNGPLSFEFPKNRHNWPKTDSFPLAGALFTRFTDSITRDFRQWYGDPVSTPNPNDFRPNSHEEANRAFHHNYNRIYFFSREPHDFAPGEIMIFTPILNQRVRDGNPTLVPGNGEDMEEGLKYTQPLTTRFLRRGETIDNITYFSHPSFEYDLHNSHRNSWRMVTFLDKSNRDTSKKKGKSRIHLSILERLAPEPTPTGGLQMPVGRTVESLVPRDYEEFAWWNTVKAGVTDKQTGHMRLEVPVNPIGRRRAWRYQGPNAIGGTDGNGKYNWGLPNDYLKDIIDTVTVQDDLYFFGCLSIQRSATDTAAEKGLPYWTHFNPRALSVLRNAENENTPFGWDVAMLPLDVAESSGRISSVTTGYPRWGPSYGPQGRQKLAMIDVPRQPMHSLVEFANADLGSYQVMPAFATGNSYASPVIQPNQSYSTLGSTNLLPARTEKFRNDKPGSNYKFMRAFNFCIPDISYHLNKALFDHYFFSTIPDIPNEPSNLGLHRFKNKNYQLRPKMFPPFRTFDQGFVLNYFGLTQDESGNLVKSGDDPSKYQLPNPRMQYHVPEAMAKDRPRFIKEYFEQLHDYETAAAHLMVDGAFNINSTSVEAWKTLLQSLSGKFGPDQAPFLRSLYPDGPANDTWEGFRTLSDIQIDTLAKAIVAEVKSRGPFRSLADFINRRLVNSKAPKPGELPEHAYSGPVQTAIDKTVNKKEAKGDKFGNVANYKPEAGSYWIQGVNFFGEHLAGKEHGRSVQAAGTPGWLMQSDVLRPIAPILNARSDTFVIRGYGDLKNNSVIRARAICEAVVQRVPDYVQSDIHQPTDILYGSHLKDRLWYEPDPSLLPGDPGNMDRDFTIKLDGDPSLKGSGRTANRNRLRRENFKLGRRYKIVHFRWL